MIPHINKEMRNEIQGLQNKNSTYITSRFQIAIDTKTIIIGHVFIQIKFYLWRGEGTNLVLNNKYDQLLSCFTL